MGGDIRGGGRPRWLVLALLTLVGPALGQSEVGEGTPQLPEGEEKALVEEICTQCHSLESTLRQRKDRTGWQKTVYDMILRGAFITTEEAEAIVNYLSRGLGAEKVDLNSASLEDLLRATPLQPAEAEAILRYRTRHGPFGSLEDLKKIKELKPERFEKIKAHLKVSPATSPAPKSD